MPIFDTVMVPLDGSPLAETALPMAVELARLAKAKLVLLRVFEEMRPIYDEQCRDVIWIDPSNPRMGLPKPEILEPVLNQLAVQGIQAHPVFRLGDPRTEIIAEAARYPEPVLVLASHGRGGLGRALLGSVATRVLQTASCPVLIVRAHVPSQPTKPVTLSRISVLLDGSALAEQALPLAVALAKAAKATLQLVRIAPTYRARIAREERGLAAPYYQFMLEQFAKLEQDLEQEARAYLVDLAKRLEPEGLAVGWEVLQGDPGRQALAYVERARPDLVVLTTHGRGGLSRWFYGSVADKLLTGSPVPILLLRSVGAETAKLDRREARMEQAQPPRADEQVTGVANVTYDALALLTSALEGAAALEVYQQDAREAGDQEAQQLFAQIQQQLNQQIPQLKRLLHKRLQ